MPSIESDTGAEIGNIELFIYTILCIVLSIIIFQVGKPQHLDTYPSFKGGYFAKFYCRNLHPGSWSPAGAQKIQLLHHGTSRHA